MPATTAREQAIAEQLLALMPHLGGLASAVARERGGVRPDRIKVLRLLGSGPQRSGELAHACFLSPSALTELVEGLVQDGLARRDSDPADRRAVLVALTPAGRRELERSTAAFAAALGEVIAVMSATERERLRTSLEALHRAFAEVRDVR